jgi:lipoprotein-anchoring transpeptidase ErfK/SrfK
MFMQRMVCSAVIFLFAGVTASAAPLSLTSETAAATPPPVQLAQAQNLGGGFLEFLFRGPALSAPAPDYQPAPALAPPSFFRQPEQMEPAPGYEQQDYASAPPTRGPINPRFMKQEVGYDGKETPGTVIINTRERLLYLVENDGRAMRYGIGVGKPGFTWAGVHHVTQKREWPDWTPPDEMLKRRPDLPRHMAGGPDNPLGARAMYLGSTLYRIHGSNEPWTIGQAVSSGCIRLRNEDVIDLYGRVKVGAKVIVI